MKKITWKTNTKDMKKAYTKRYYNENYKAKKLGVENKMVHPKNASRKEMYSVVKTVNGRGGQSIVHLKDGYVNADRVKNYNKRADYLQNEYDKKGWNKTKGKQITGGANPISESEYKTTSKKDLTRLENSVRSDDQIEKNMLNYKDAYINGLSEHNDIDEVTKKKLVEKIENMDDDTFMDYYMSNDHVDLDQFYESDGVGGNRDVLSDEKKSDLINRILEW